MSYLDRIAECNNHDLDRFVPFTVAGHDVGWIRSDRLAVLAEVAPCLDVQDGRVSLSGGGSFETRSAALAPAIEALMQRGEISAWRAERYPVKTWFGASPLLQMERSAVGYFGVHAYGVHVNGFVRRDDGIYMWVARRAQDKPTYPGMLDNTVAGGQPISLSVHDNMIKESAEEAGIERELALQARPTGAVTYCFETDSGLKPDCMFCYDLELPSDFVPHCTDGEVEAFYLWSIAKVADVVRTSRQFKFNTNLVVLDFMVRHGLLGPDEPDYLEIVKGLHSWGGQ